MVNPGKRHTAKERVQSEMKEISTLVEATLSPFDSSKLKYFSELPISQKTKQGLNHANYVEMTDIQRTSLGYCLCGRDILGAAKTGSGKTLAFIIPVLECLFKQNWSMSDGLGALIISPTRELALQIFNVLRKIGKNHHLSAGLAIGGKDVQYEKDRINRMNILVCTPGRLLQHMDQTANFNCDHVQILVLDEADRILDLGFKKTVNAILENLPKERQTLLFSATQTKSVSDLARLSLTDPEYVAVHELAEKSTPDTLQQNYLVCQLFEKLDVLYSFIKTHLKSKCLIFLSSCKQVRFVFETFCKMQPGTVVMCLHGKQKQAKRDIMFDNFCKVKAAVMICTDIAARGLDFPSVDWVIQVDAPEDAETYIHRVGRTARYNSNGKALMFLLPSEEKGMASLLEKKKVPISKIRVNSNKTQSIVPALRSICAQNPDVKYLGEKAFICYLRSIWLQKNKEIFDIGQLPLEEYASSMGLPGAPRVKFVRKLKAQKNQSRQVQNILEGDEKETNGTDTEKKQDSKIAASIGELSQASADENLSDNPENMEEEVQEEKLKCKKPGTRTRLEKMFAKKNQSVLWEHYQKIKETDNEPKTAEEEKNSDDDFMTVARRDHELEGIPTMAPNFLERPLSVRDKRNMKLKKRIQKEGGSSTKITFDDEGAPHLAWQLETEKEFMNDEDSIFAKHEKFLEAAKQVMSVADKEDKQAAKDKLREKRLKRKLKGKKDSDLKDSIQIQLGSPQDDFNVQNNEEESNYESFSDDGYGAELRDKKLRMENIDDAEELALKLLGN